PAPRGVPQIEVTFDIDANGIVSVSAKDKATGKEQNIRIQAKSGLSEADIQRMIKEAEANAEADRRRREAVEARNHLDALIHSTEKTLKENEGKLPEAEKRAAEEAIAEARRVLDSQEAATLRSAADRLSTAAMKLGEALYRAGAQQNPAGADGGGSQGEKVVDAEFEEVDPKKQKPH
ncbi:MAG: Hsp70 family protein, partial [Elioraea sp.]|nr:Hsp70 family protein [Elioraea sp.]